MQGFVVSGPFAWALALVKPNTSPRGLPNGHSAFPSTYSIMSEVSLPQTRFVRGARDVWPPARCPEYMFNNMVRFVHWGTMLHELLLYIVSHGPISQKAKLRIKKNWETKLIFGCCDHQKFLKKKKKSPDLPYLVLIPTYVARNMSG
jgi:hypothetical protein